MHLAIKRLLILLLFPAAFVLAQGFAPKVAVQRMQVADGLEVQLVASEPEIRQPVTMDFDDRGRMWVIQYLQYPNPAGLKPVKVDQYLRTIYDRVPEPPPKGPRGADCITILQDDGTGHFRKVKDFVTGLNLASGLCLGYGGAFVVQPPYLLFYPDRNGDDVPDSDPQVLLKGFGMQDAHALANSLQWGPDGWLYGAQGSTVTANIRGISFQQGIWRYHPITHAFELFAEGGGNTWGLDFDRHGNIIAGTNFGNVTMLHQVQGAYYVKGFAKHGPLHNPHAYGYFDHVPYRGFKGGHVTCGGVLYEGGTFPKRFDHTYMAANPLANALYWHVLERKDSSFTAHFGGDLLLGHDTWFRPVDCLVGPDGALYVADWYDKRINHVDPVDNWDRSNGRIYRIQGKGAKPDVQVGFSKLTSKELVGLLSHPNIWCRREARLTLAERRDSSVIPELRQLVLLHRDQLALEALWALYVSGGFNDNLAATLLDHPNDNVRAWTVRFLGDAKKVSSTMARQLVNAARRETSSVVRNQMACSAKRLPAKDALPIIRALLGHSEDVRDPQIPMLLWWAIENKTISDRADVLSLLDSPAMWRNPIVKRFLIERLSRRYMDEGKEEDLATCGKLLTEAPGAAERELVVRGMEKALAGRRLVHVPLALSRQVDRLWRRHSTDLNVTRLALRLGNQAAYVRALGDVEDSRTPPGYRTGLIEVLGQLGRPDCVPHLLHLLEPAHRETVRRAALSALQPFTDPAIANTILRLYSTFSATLKTRAQSLLLSRLDSTRLLIKAVDTGRIPAKDLPFDQARKVLLFHDKGLATLVEKHWGTLTPATPGQKRARIASINHMLDLGRGNKTRGKVLFQKTCAVCHTLFGEGNKIGPDLTGTDRRDRNYLITSIVDPSAAIRKEYVAYVVETTNGRVLTGLLAESTPKTITLLDAKNEHLLIPRAEIESMKASATSLMPEKLLDPFDDQQICDLFSYLQSKPAATNASGLHSKPARPRR
jgi:putative membrane-bound dehydrogenase-like protein